MSSPGLRVFGATYGPASTTEKVVSLVKNGKLNVVANDDTFGNTWKGVNKSLTVIYQYGDEEPIVAIAEEGKTLNIVYKPGDADYLPPTDPMSLNIVGAAYGRGDVTTTVKGLVQAGQLNFTANDLTFGNTWPGEKKSFTLVYQYGRNPPFMKTVEQQAKVSVQKEVPPPYLGQILTRGLLDTGDVVSFSASNNMYIAADIYGKLVAVKDGPDETISFIVTKNTRDSTVCFRTNTGDGKYIVVGSDKFLHATGSQSEAAWFDISLSTTGGIRLASSKTQKYARLGPDNLSIIVDAVNSFSLSTFFGIALLPTSTSMILERRGIVALEALEELSPCDTAWLGFIWNLTGGFFLAIGLGPLISTGTPQPGFLGLIRSNPEAWAAVQGLLQLVQTGNGVVATVVSLLTTLRVLYQQNILWGILKWLLNFGVWTALTSALTKILEFILTPELVAAEVLASFIAWQAQMVVAAVEVDRACN